MTPKTPEILIIADDMTGALDSGVKLATAGIPAFASVDSNFEGGFPGKALVVNTESRHLSAGEAYSRVYKIAEKAREMGIPLIYKKVDSALRGNIGAELQAVSDALGDRIVFAPALPQAGRTTIGGIQHVFGRPLAESEFANDPLNPMKNSDIRGIIAAQSSIGTISVNDPEDYQPGEEKIIICDAETDCDLKIVSEFAIRRKISCIAGSAGLAAFLPEISGIKAVPPRNVSFKKPVLFLVGSVNEVAFGQTKSAEIEGISCRTMTAEEFFSEKMSGEAISASVGALLREGAHIIRSASSRADLIAVQNAAFEQNISAGELAAKVSRTFGNAAKELYERIPGLTIAVFGGDTLTGTLRGLGVSRVELLSELLPGTVLASSGGTKIIAKAGGFGGADIIARLLKMAKKADGRGFDSFGFHFLFTKGQYTV